MKFMEWVSECITTAVKVVKKAAKIAHEAASVVDALLEVKTIIVEDTQQKVPFEQKKIPADRPDILSQQNPQSRLSEISELQQRIDESKKKITIVEETNELEHHRIKLHMDIMELVVSSSTVERFGNNINLHAANLQIHLQTIQNTAGLLHDVNRQRVAIKALMGTVNHLVNVLGVSSKVDKIEGLDINKREGSISIHGALSAYENTRSLLVEEIDSYTEALEKQLKGVENVRATARHIPGISLKVSSWLADSVEPKLINAKKSAIELKADLEMIPHLEANLRREAETIEQDTAL